MTITMVYILVPIVTFVVVFGIAGIINYNIQKKYSRRR